MLWRLVSSIEINVRSTVRHLQLMRAPTTGSWKLSRIRSSRIQTTPHTALVLGICMSSCACHRHGAARTQQLLVAVARSSARDTDFPQVIIHRYN